MFINKLETIYSYMLSMLCDSSFLVLFETMKMASKDCVSVFVVCFYDFISGFPICFLCSIWRGLSFLYSFSPVFLSQIGYTEASWINPDVMHKWCVYAICVSTNVCSKQWVRKRDRKKNRFHKWCEKKMLLVKSDKK